MSHAAERFAWRLLVLLAALFAIGVALGLHGYSISVWRSYLDGSSSQAIPHAPEILLGTARPIRSDDWNVIIPLSLAQREHTPRFPIVNGLIGVGQNAQVPFPLPVADPLAVFRPATWGWFLGSDTGLAWQWWSQLLGLFGALALFFFAAARFAGPGSPDDPGRGRAGFALAAALLVVGSPFVLFWSLRTASVPAFGAVAAVAALGIASTRRPAAIFGCGALLAWAGACFVLELYPPFQIPTAIFFGGSVLALLYERRTESPWRQHAAFRVLALAAGVTIPVAALVLLFTSAGDAIEAMRNTAFPGRRASTGGERTLFELVGGNIALAWRVEKWGPLLNICEAAGFLVLGVPLAAAALTRRDGRGTPALGTVERVALAVVVACAIHAVAGIPEWLARATGLSLVPGRRSMVALGLADALLAMRLLARPGGVGAGPRAAIAIGALWAALLALASWRAAATLPESPFALGLGLAVGSGALVAWAASARRGVLPLAVAAAASLAVSVWFNPLVRGGGDSLREIPLAREILAIDAERGGASTWVSFGGPYLPNLFRALGVHALNGLHPIPQPALWSRLDPDGKFRVAWNRYAHLAFVAWPRRDLDVRMLSNDTLIVSMNPREPALQDLGVTHMLVETDDPATFTRISGHVLRASIGNLHLFEARWDEPPARRAE